MMLIRGPYDYEIENQKRVATARLGIELGAQVYLTETNEEVRVDTYHQELEALAESKEAYRKRVAGR
jgi:hypothetical protein